MEIHIYTDGSCFNNPGPGGWGVYVPVIHKEMYGRDKITTNNKMELTAMKHAISYILSDSIKIDFGIQSINNISFKIHTDSTYVKNGWETWVSKWIKNNWKTSGNIMVKNKELWLELYTLKEKLRDLNVSYNLNWVKAHNGDINNEYVDKIAKYHQN